MRLRSQHLFVFVMMFSSLAGALYVERDILDILSVKAVDIAKCRSACVTTLANANVTNAKKSIGSGSNCDSDCQNCWNSCPVFMSLARESPIPICNNSLGCITAREAAYFQSQNKNSNRVRSGTASKRRQPEVKFPDKPEFLRQSCVISWKTLQQDPNSIYRLQQKNRGTPSGLVFVLFGKDQLDKWYELGQTSSYEMVFSPTIMSKMSEVRVLAVTSTGVVDKSSVSTSECYSAPTLPSRLESSLEETTGTDNPQPDRFFYPLVTICVLLGLACLAVFALIVSAWTAPKKKVDEGKECEESTKTAANFQFGNNNNVSIEIFEEKDQRIYTIFKPDQNQELQTAESKLKAHVCYSKCGLGPEYLQFVRNTQL